MIGNWPALRSNRANRQTSGPAEEISGEGEVADTCRFASLSVNRLIANHGRVFKIDAVNRRELRDHPPLGLAALTAVGIVIRADHPSGEDTAELAIELVESGFGL